MDRKLIDLEALKNIVDKYNTLSPEKPKPEYRTTSERTSIRKTPIVEAVPTVDNRDEDRSSIEDEIRSFKALADKDLIEKRQKAEERENISMMLRGVNQIAGGNLSLNSGSQVKMHDEYLDDLDKQTKQKVLNVEADREKKFKDLIEQYNMLRQNTKDKREGVFSEFDRKLKVAQANQNTDINKTRTEEVNPNDIKQARLDLALEKFEHAKKEKDELSDKQTEAITNLDNTMDLLKRIKTDKKGQDTGPIASRMNAAASMLGIDNAKTSAFKAEVMDSLSERIKMLSGTAVSEPEAKRLSSMMPTMTDNDATFNEKVDLLGKKLREHKDNTLRNITNQGKDPSRFMASENVDTSNPKVDMFMSKNPSVKSREEAFKILKDAGKL